MKEAIKWILSAVVGVVVSFIILMISSGIHVLLTCGIVAYGVAAILYYVFLKKSDMKLLISVIASIVTFFLYFCLYSYVNDYSDSWVIALLVIFVPYILCSYLFFHLVSLANQNNNNDNNKV